MKVCSLADCQPLLGKSFQAEYLARYLTALGAETVVVEDGYIDKDYLLDYSNFYCRSFSPHEKDTTRLHFFKDEFTEKDFLENFHCNDDFRTRLKGEGNYLGFVVVKPIASQINSNFIGRTLLKSYDHQVGTDKRGFLSHEYEASLYGLNLTVKSLPYQMQDSIVAACATTAIWSSLNALNKSFGVPLQSPYEITNTSVGFPGTDRNFPSAGLTTFQMKNYFNAIGIETEEINVEAKPTALPAAIKAYLNYNLPIIAVLRFEERDSLNQLKRKNYHAVVVSGYRINTDNEIVELYIHDDGIGPYSRVLPMNGNAHFTSWKNEWISERGYTHIYVEKLIVPLYPKIRLSFNKLFDLYTNFNKSMSEQGFGMEFFLTDIKQYKRELLSKNIDDKMEFLTSPCPKYIWVFRTIKDQKTIIDTLLDATSILSDGVLREINYIQS
ncbi:hypothetical protein HNV12_28105 [Methanococcoides sp. SA1]|nr:hypothetical protein [Methanococcoides sp. SA1]